MAAQNRPSKKVPQSNLISKSASGTSVSKQISKDEPSNAMPKKNSNEAADMTAVQSIAVIAGRKYIMVPKTAKVQNASPDSTNGNQTTKSS